MSIEFKLDPVLSQYTNSQQLSDVSGDTVGECLNSLAEQFPELKTVLFDENGYLNGYIAVSINGNPQDEQLFSPVKDGDEVSLALSVGGC